MEMPGAVAWLLPIVVGESWPEGDEDKLRALRDAWHVASKSITPVAEIGSKAASEVVANWTGDSATAFAEQWKKFTDGDEAYFKSLADAAQALGDSCDQTALDIEYTKYMIIISLVILAAQIVAMIAAAAPSFGTSTAGIVPAQVATRMTVQMLFRELLQKLAQQGFKQLAKELLEQFLKQGLKKIAKEVATNVAMNVAMDAGIQGVQMASGDRKDWDWSKTKDGAIGGAVDGVVGAASGGLSKKMAGDEGFGIAGKAVQGATEGVASTVGQAAVTGDLGNLTAKDILTGASSGAVSGGVDGAKDHFKSVNSPDTPNTPTPDGSSDSSPTPSSPRADGGSSSSNSANSSDNSPAPAATPGGNDHVTQQSAPAPVRPDGAPDAQRAAAPASQAQHAAASDGQQSSQQQGNSAPQQAAPAQAAPPAGGSAPAGSSSAGSSPSGSSGASSAGSHSSSGGSAAGGAAPSNSPGSSPGGSASAGAAPSSSPGSSPGGSASGGAAPSNSPSSSSGGSSPAHTSAGGSSPAGSSPAGPSTTGSSPAQSSPGGSPAPMAAQSSPSGPAPGGSSPAPPSPGGSAPTHSSPGGPPPTHSSPGGSPSPAPFSSHGNSPAPPAGGYGMAQPPPGNYGPPPGGQNPGQHGARPQDSVNAAGFTQNPGQRPDFGQQPPPQQPPFPGQQPPPPGGFPPPPPPGGGHQGGPNQPPRQGPPPGQPPRHGPPPNWQPSQDPRRGNYFQQDPRGGPGPQHRSGPPSGPVQPPRPPGPPPGPPGQRGPSGYPQQPPRPPQAYGPGQHPQQHPQQRPPMPPPGPGQRPMPPPGFDPRQQQPPQVPGPRQEPPPRAFEGYRGSLDEPAPVQQPREPAPAAHQPETPRHPESEPAQRQAEPEPRREPEAQPEPERTPVAEQSISDRLNGNQDRPDFGEDYLADPDHRGSAADHESIRRGIGNDENFARLHDTALARRDGDPALAHVSDDAAVAIHAYSRELYDVVNAPHRLGEADPGFAAAQAQNRAIDGALNELPPHVGPLVRGLNFNGDPRLAELAAAHYVEGQVTVEPSLTSASMKLSDDQRFKFGDDVVLQIDSKTSRDISSLAENKGEHEALSKAGTQLYVHEKTLTITPDGKRQWVIRAEEVTPGDPRHLDPDTAKQKTAERRERFAAEAAEVKERNSRRIADIFGGPAEPVPDVPATHDSSEITSRLDGDHTPDEPMPQPQRTGEPDWSSLAQATNPPSEPAIHAGTATPEQQAAYIAQRHPELTAVNPNFHTPDAFANGYVTNCTRGVVAYAQRMAGLDAHAVPLLPADMARHGTLDSVQQRLGGDWQSHGDYDSVIREMNDRPVGSHAVIGVLYPGPDGQTYGHVAMVVHTDDGVAFIDPQSGSLMNLPQPPSKIDLLPFEPLNEDGSIGTPADKAEQTAAEQTQSEQATPEKTETPKAPVDPRIAFSRPDDGHHGYDVQPSRIGPDGRPVPTFTQPVPGHTPEHAGYGTPQQDGASTLPTREEIDRYLADPRVDEALNRANQPDSSGEVPRVDGVPLGDAVRRMLPDHPELVRVMQNADYLETSLLARPQTMVGLMQHPEAMPILESAVAEVNSPDPEAPPLADAPEATPLEPGQRETSREVAEAASAYTDEDRVQPGFDSDRRRDEGYRDEYMADLYGKAGPAQAELTRIVNQLAADNDGEAHARKELKKLGRANDKIDADYGGDASRLVDVAGAYIQFDKVKDIYAALAVLSTEPNLEIVKFKDRFAKPMGSGYRDLQMSVRMSNGHIAELRLHLKALDEVAVYEHAVYEVRRDLDAAAFDDGDRPLTREEAALRDALVARERDLFWAALQGGL
jgi:uncharacterized protein YukE